ncbi:MAG TPA: cytochrome c [Xanthobacteraceae bacterium]|jgi:mono/diheme cytochrome c family protein|nr:cytochrome c [Xanthobacteraceae bacterium]
MFTRSVDPKYGALLAAAVAVLAMPSVALADGYPAQFEFGAPASNQDIAAVAIAIAPDGKGLPAGKGDHAAGKRVYEAKCGDCHGATLQGVPGLPDMPAGAALRLIGGRGTLTTGNPVMTVESYWPYATTLFDYIRRAMPFQSPGSLNADELYAVSAYILAEGNVIDKTMVLDAQTLPRVQMPNRDGFIADPRPEFFR